MLAKVSKLIVRKDMFKICQNMGEYKIILQYVKRVVAKYSCCKSDNYVSRDFYF